MVLAVTLCQREDVSALATRIGELLGDEGRPKAFGERGRETVRERFTFAAQSVRYQELFERLACQAGAGKRPLVMAG